VNLNLKLHLKEYQHNKNQSRLKRNQFTKPRQR